MQQMNIKPDLWGPVLIPNGLVAVLEILAIVFFLVTPADGSVLRLACEAGMHTCFTLVVVGSRKLHTAMVAWELQLIGTAVLLFEHQSFLILLLPLVLYTLLYHRISKTLQQSKVSAPPISPRPYTSPAEDRLNTKDEIDRGQHAPDGIEFTG